MFTHTRKFTIPLLMGFLFLSLACATSIPFLESNSEAAPVEEVDPNAVQTMIADAVDKKIAQTLAAMPPTKIPTATSTETPIPSPTVTEIPSTSTPTELPYPESGNKLEENGAGSLTYIDYAGAYQVNIPANWLAIRPGETEYDEAMLLTENPVPEVRQSLEELRDLDPNIFRLFILDVQEGHYSSGFVSNINFVLNDEGDASLEEIFAQSVIALPGTISGLNIISADITTTALGVSIGTIETEWDLKDDDTGQVIRVYQKQALLVIQKRPLVITFTSTVDFKDQILKDFDTMVYGLELLD